VRHEASARRGPLVLSAAEGCDLDWTSKPRARIGTPTKCDANAVRIFLVAIDHRQRPFAIRALQSIRSDEFAASAVVDIGFGRIDLTFSGRNMVDPSSQSLTGDEAVGGMRDINGDGLRRGEKTENRDGGKKLGRNFQANASRSKRPVLKRFN